MFRGKNYKESAKLIDKQALYDPMEAFDLVIKASKAKFDETVELHVKLGVDGRHADQQVRGDRKSTRLNSSHNNQSRMPSSA